MGVGLILYTVGHVYTWFSHDVVIKRTVQCRYCRKFISAKVCMPLEPCNHVWKKIVTAKSEIVGNSMRELYQLAGWERRFRR